MSILDGEKLLNKNELDFFLKGNTSLDDLAQAKPFPWVPDQGWKDIQTIGKVDEVYKNFMNDLSENGDIFKKWYDSERPELEELPLQYNKLSAF
jgi:dynein heavy chain